MPKKYSKPKTFFANGNHIVFSTKDCPGSAQIDTFGWRCPIYEMFHCPAQLGIVVVRHKQDRNMDVVEQLLAERVFAGPVAFGARMADRYSIWDGPAGVDLQAIANEFLRRLNQRDSAIGDTCLNIAAAVERWGGHAYHSVRHHAEVATNAMILTEPTISQANTLSDEQRALLLASCLAHDIYFEPSSAGRSRFEAEAKSAQALDAIATGCGVPAGDRAVLRTLVLATEPGFRRQLSALLRGETDMAADTELQIPASEPAVAAMAGVLSDADLLSSAGLTMDWHVQQRRRLEHELGHAISPVEDLRFFDTIVGPNFLSAGGQVFNGNLYHIRETICRSAAGTTA